MNSFPKSSYSTEGEAVLRPSLLFRPLELDRAWLRLFLISPLVKRFRLSLVTWIRDSHGRTGRLDVRQLFSRKCGSCLDLENSSSTPLFVKTFLWARDCSPVVLFHFLSSILHLNEGCSNRFKIIKSACCEAGTQSFLNLSQKSLRVQRSCCWYTSHVRVFLTCLNTPPF